ncbi:MAG: endonuclease III [Chloroflexi bacterium]|nr:MAG: endonuclease III [Chloroflexota bacterium]
MQDQDIHRVMAILRDTVKQWQPAVVDEMAEQKETTPYHILITTILSLRTKDTLTVQIAPRLFALADTPEQMVRLDEETIAQTIYPVGFYRNKARSIRQISQKLLDEYGGRVPDTLEELLQLPGVGRKTANLVLTAGFRKPGICVDTHVHRISNRWGYVQTRTPEQTEFALREKLPPEYWLEYNALLVAFGQNLCTPVSPWCSLCPLTAYCDRVGVERSR